MVCIPGGSRPLESQSSSLVDLAIIGSSAHLYDGLWQYSQTVIAVLLACNIAFEHTGLLCSCCSIPHLVLSCLVVAKIKETVLTLLEIIQLTEIAL